MSINKVKKAFGNGFRVLPKKKTQVDAVTMAAPKYASKNTITATAPTIKVKPKKNGNAVPGQRGITYNGPQFKSRQADSPQKAKNTMYKVGHTEDLKQLTKSNIKSTVNTQSTFTSKVNFDISASDKKAISKYQPAPSSGSPRGHYATRMAQGLLNRPTSDEARKKLYKK